MKLNPKQFKRFRELEAKVKANKANESEKAEYDELLKLKTAKKEESSFKPGNDFAWWNKIPALIKDCASFKCNWIPGTAVAPGAFASTGVGVLQVEVDAVLGNSIAPTDTVNIWARDLFLKMFQKYRPASGYSASDLGITILAALEAVKLIAYYERIYGILNRYSKLNVNVPVVEAAALGLSATDVTYLQGHMSDFRYDLNYLIRKAQRLCVPKDMSVVSDAIAMFGYEYSDHTSVRSQMILFVPTEYGIYSDTTLTSGGSIKYSALSTLFNFGADNMCVALEAVLNPLLGSDSVQRIFADLVVWFGASAMLEFLPVPEDYVIVPAYSESILHRLHNAETYETGTYRLCSIMDNSLSSADISTIRGEHFIYQVNDRIVTGVTAINIPSGATTVVMTVVQHGVAADLLLSSAAAPICLRAGHIIDTAHEDTTPEIIVEGSLLKEFNVKVSDGSSGEAILLESTGFYKVRDYKLYSTGGPSANLSTTDTNLTSVRSIAGMLTCIDWAPIAHYVDASGISQDMFGEYDNVVFVSNPDVSRIQRTIILSGLESDMQVVNK